MKKLLKRIVLTITAALAVLIIGLIINNRVFYSKYVNVNTKKDVLSEEDINRVHEVFGYLEKDGSSMFTGFDGKGMAVLIYNEAYEFLFSDVQLSGQEWTYIGQDEDLQKYIYRRVAVNSQAFAVKIEDTWVGSFATMDTFHKQMLNEIPIIYPPQLIILDEAYYKAFVIHEMAHAYQGLLNSKRVDDAEHISDVCSSFLSNGQFNDLVEQEANYLETALKAEDLNTVRENVKGFLVTRTQRRQECQMSDQDIHNEQELEWLEGLGRYAEYIASEGSSAPISKGLEDISTKVKVQGDDRYYALGMAEYMIILKLEPKYEQKVLEENVALEEVLDELSMK